LKSWRLGNFLISVSLLVAAGCSLLEGCPPAAGSGKTKLVVFEAGSLMVPFAAMEKAFETANPDIDVEIQAHGSIQVVRHVTELGEDVDIVAVADYSLIPMLMYQTFMTDGRPYADWYIRPATNQLVLAYAPGSKYSDELTIDNWYDIVSRPDVKLGLSDPRMDAVGYRTIMVAKLAESYYSQDNIMHELIGKHFTQPLAEFDNNNGVSLVTVPELLEPAGDHMYLRGSSLQCISLLQSGDIDYTFEYKSVVAQQGLSYLELPPEVNLGYRALSDGYARVKVKIDFRRFRSVVPEFQGLPIIYGLTIANSSTRQSAAVRFIQFVLSPDGQRIFSDCHHPLLQPPECDNPEKLPATLRALFP
jgi:molybdate/tungstate transport system substrate-binding protein